MGFIPGPSSSGETRNLGDGHQVEYLITRLPFGSQVGRDDENQDFLNQLGVDGWFLIKLDGRRAILARRKS